MRNKIFYNVFAPSPNPVTGFEGDNHDRYASLDMHAERHCSKVRALSDFGFQSMLVSYPAKPNNIENLATETQVSELGNSDRIRLKFGNYGIEIVENELRIRVSNLYSMADGVRTNRTFAVVMYPDVIEPAFSKEHEAIINGQSIGIVFRENGWQIEKHHQYIGELEIGSDFSAVHSVFGDIGDVRPVIHVYSLLIKKDNTQFHYASIAEVHHPGYLGLEDLRAIFGNEFDGNLEMDRDIVDFLKIVETRMQGVGLLAP